MYLFVGVDKILVFEYRLAKNGGMLLFEALGGLSKKDGIANSQKALLSRLLLRVLKKIINCLKRWAIPRLAAIDQFLLIEKDRSINAQNRDRKGIDQFDQRSQRHL